MKRWIAFTFGAVLAIGLFFSIARKVRAAGPTFTTIDFPGSPATLAADINDSGQIVGEHLYGNLLGINDAGEIVGLYRDSKQGKDHGFLLSGSTFTSIDFPGADQTHAIGIDSADRIFGSYCIGGNACYNPGESVHGFTLSGGTFTTIDFPGAISTEVWGQDRGGQIAGRYQDANGVFHIFLLSSGSFVSIDFPGAAETAPSFYSADGGFNAGGDISSSYCSAEPCANPSPSVHSFLLKDGQFVPFDPPGTPGSFALGMNSIDEIVGAYVGQDGHYHGYLWTP